MKNILKHWINGRTIEWIANREGLTVLQVANSLGFGVRRK